MYTYLSDVNLCLKDYIDLRNFTDAADKCRSDGADLITIDTAEKLQVFPGLLSVNRMSYSSRYNNSKINKSIKMSSIFLKYCSNVRLTNEYFVLSDILKHSSLYLRCNRFICKLLLNCLLGKGRGKTKKTKENKPINISFWGLFNEQNLYKLLKRNKIPVSILFWYQVKGDVHLKKKNENISWTHLCLSKSN